STDDLFPTHPFDGFNFLKINPRTSNVLLIPNGEGSEMAGRFQDQLQGRRSHAAAGHALAAILAITSLSAAMPSKAADYAADQAIRNELSTIMDEAIRRKSDRAITITRAWAYLHPDKSLLFCGAGFSSSSVTTFVVFMD